MSKEERQREKQQLTAHSNILVPDIFNNKLLISIKYCELC